MRSRHEKRGERPVPRSEEDCTLAPDRVHHRKGVVHPLLQRAGAAGNDRIGESKTSRIEPDESTERCETVVERGQSWFFVDGVDRQQHLAREREEVAGAAAQELIGHVHAVGSQRVAHWRTRNRR